MNPRIARRPSLYEQLAALPEGLTGEVITKSTGREEKMPLYARYGVFYSWLVDPDTRSLEAYHLVGGQWTPLGFFRDDDTVSVAPFDAITIRLVDLWA